MNFADKQRKNYWNLINHNTNKSIADTNSSNPKTANKDEKNNSAPNYKVITDNSYKPNPFLFENDNLIYNSEKDEKNSGTKKPLYEHEKEQYEYEQINNLLKRISIAEFSDKEKISIEKEFDKVQDIVENSEYSSVVNKNNLLKKSFNEYLNAFYEIKLQNQNDMFNNMHEDISKLSFKDYDKKYSDFYFNDLCKENLYEPIKEYIIKDSNFSTKFKDILDYFLKNKSKILVKRYNKLIEKLKKSEYKNKKITYELINEYESLIPKLTKLNILITYFNNFKKIKFKKFNVSSMIEKDNNEIKRREYEKNKEFFNNFQGKKLDKDQIDVILSDEYNSKVIAGAGTGKTFTLQAKLKYLIDYKDVSQDKILCISFSKAAVEDLKRKIKKTIGENNVDVYTYHALGRKILIDDNSFSSSNSQLLRNTIEYYFEEHVLSDEYKMKKIIDFFNLYNYTVNLDKRSLKLEKNGEFYKVTDGMTVETLKNKVHNSLKYSKVLGREKQSYDRIQVRSYEELLIANFLYINDIEYIYEDNYFRDRILKDENDLIQYHPDFYLPEKGIYIEHFGVDENLNANWIKKKSDRIKYKRSIFLKRKLHKKYNTKLIETYSHLNQKGILLDELKDRLEENGVEFGEIDYGRIYERLIKNKQLDNLKQVTDVIEKFIVLFKDMGLNIDENGDDCFESGFENLFEEIDLKDNNYAKKRNRFLLEFIHDIYIIYNSKDNIDYPDMINKAFKLIKDDYKIKNYDYIFVDEYQDTSYNKYKFLKELKNSTDAKLIVIGDDWQSIYGFNGCEIQLFTNFEDYFDYTKTFKIQKIYRNSNNLIDMSSKFIKENASQTMKDLYSDKNLPDNPIKLTKTSNPKRFALIFKSIIDEIIQNYPNGEILILGRYNNDFKKILIPDLFECEDAGDYLKILKEKGFLTIKYLERNDIIIKFRTIHKAKGLQADNVIIIGLKDDKKYGFPSLYDDDPLITHILNRQTEDVEFPEERRLFYVALTRTKNNVYLIADKINPSRFVEKILYLDKNNSIEFREYDFDIDEIVRMNNLLKRTGR